MRTHVYVIYRGLFMHITHTNTHAFRNTHCIFVLTYYRTSKHTYTYAQLKHRPRWCFHVCVALRSVRMLETSAPQGFEEGWAGMTGGK